MRNENGIDIDIEALNKLLNTADLITIGFTLFPERLLVDTRSNDQGAPVRRHGRAGREHPGTVRLAGQASRQLRRARRFRLLRLAPDRPRLDRARCPRATQARLTSEARRDLDVALATAAELERGAIVEAIKGSDRWPAVWERAA
ncbi:MAG: hypothetical protein IPI33_09320 [Dehalococcoidia bacterium]|nr:hypothetical protein [Dehalococcoidia bacterium]